jgi:hypothetical protein
MFYAVYTNGATDMKPTFEMLHHSSEHILFFAKSHTDASCRHYLFLNSKGEIAPLIVNGGKLISIIYNFSAPSPTIELEVEQPNRGVERVEIYREDNFYFSPLSIVAAAIRSINKLGVVDWVVKVKTK